MILTKKEAGETAEVIFHTDSMDLDLGLQEEMQSVLIQLKFDKDGLGFNTEAGEAIREGLKESK